MGNDVQETAGTCAVCGGRIAADGTLWVHVDGVSRVHRAEPTQRAPGVSATCPYCGADIMRDACRCAGMMPCTYPGCMGTADGASCRHPRAEDDAPGAECAGCAWGTYAHTHDPAEDGPILDCCAHTCGRPTRVPGMIAGRRVWRAVRYGRHCPYCTGMVWHYRRGMYATPEDAAGFGR